MGAPSEAVERSIERAGPRAPADDLRVRPEVGPAEDCTNAVDDDGDGLVDCGDPECTRICDGDADGFLDVAVGGTDCDDRSPWINPGAPDHCEDGIDQDCRGGDAQCLVQDTAILRTLEDTGPSDSGDSAPERGGDSQLAIWAEDSG